MPDDAKQLVEAIRDAVTDEDSAEPAGDWRRRVLDKLSDTRVWPPILAAVTTLTLILSVYIFFAIARPIQRSDIVIDVVENLKLRIIDLKHELTDLSDKRAALAATVGDLEQARRLIERAKQLENEQGALVAADRLRQLEEQANSLTETQRKLDEAESKLGETETKLAETETALAQARRRLISDTQAAAPLKSELSRKNERIGSLRKQVNDRDARIQDLLRDVQRLEREVVKLDEQLSAKPTPEQVVVLERWRFVIEEFIAKAGLVAKRNAVQLAFAKALMEASSLYDQNTLPIPADVLKEQFFIRYPQLRAIPVLRTGEEIIREQLDNEEFDLLSAEESKRLRSLTQRYLDFNAVAMTAPLILQVDPRMTGDELRGELDRLNQTYSAFFQDLENMRSFLLSSR